MATVRERGRGQMLNTGDHSIVEDCACGNEVKMGRGGAGRLGGD